VHVCGGHFIKDPYHIKPAGVRGVMILSLFATLARKANCPRTHARAHIITRTADVMWCGPTPAGEAQVAARGRKQRNETMEYEQAVNLTGRKA
jgi:hypothetical protein